MNQLISEATLLLDMETELATCLMHYRHPDLSLMGGNLSRSMKALLVSRGEFLSRFGKMMMFCGTELSNAHLKAVTMGKKGAGLTEKQTLIDNLGMQKNRGA